jgi:TatD DNase family protein
MTSAHFDSHCHLQDPRFAGRVRSVVDQARAAGVTHMVCCATREADWDRVLELARDQPGVLPMLGLHPWYAAEAAAGWPGRLRARMAGTRAGIGECGLDFTPGRPGRAVQEAAFAAQLALAAELGLPVSIHCVGAWGRLQALLRAAGPLTAGAVHGFSGSPEVAAALQDLGLHLGFSASAVRPGARRGPRALAAVAADRLLFESDAPSEGREPAQVAELALAAARVRDTVPEALAAQVQTNAMACFRRILP